MMETKAKGGMKAIMLTRRAGSTVA